MKIIIRNVEIGLRAIGAWPGLKTSKFIFVLLAIFTLSLIFQISNMIAVFKELDLLMNNLGTTMPVLSSTLKLCVFRLKYSSVRIVVKEMLEDWKSEKEVVEREVMMRNTKLGVYLSNAIAVCYNSLITSYLVLAILSYNAESIHDRQFVMQAAFPEEAKRSPMFEILCLVQFTVAFFVANCHAVLEGLLTVSVLHANSKAFSVCCEISKFAEICEYEGSDESKKLRAKEKLIKKHLNFINFTKCIQDTFSYVSFFHLFLMTLINCIVGYMFINLAELNADNNIVTLLLCIAYMFTALSAVASYCIAGEYLTWQGRLIFDELYNCSWYKFKPNDIRVLAFMIMKSRQPVTITAGNFGNLSLAYFTSIIKTSVSYLSLVRASKT